METTISVDTGLLTKVMRIFGSQTQRQIVEDALRLYASQGKQADMRKYRGKLHWEGNLEESRQSRWSL
jgi:Arc/MetJ family transcription regulator